MAGGGGAGSSLPAAGAFVVGVPVFLLTLDGAVGGVPAAVVHGLLLTVITLQHSGTNPTSGRFHLAVTPAEGVNQKHQRCGRSKLWSLNSPTASSWFGR